MSEDLDKFFHDRLANHDAGKASGAHWAAMGSLLDGAMPVGGAPPSPPPAPPPAPAMLTPLVKTVLIGAALVGTSTVAIVSGVFSDDEATPAPVAEEVVLEEAPTTAPEFTPATEATTAAEEGANLENQQPETSQETALATPTGENELTKEATAAGAPSNGGSNQAMATAKEEVPYNNEGSPEGKPVLETQASFATPELAAEIGTTPEGNADNVVEGDVTSRGEEEMAVEEETALEEGALPEGLAMTENNAGTAPILEEERTDLGEEVSPNTTPSADRNQPDLPLMDEPSTEATAFDLETGYQPEQLAFEGIPANPQPGRDFLEPVDFTPAKTIFINRLRFHLLGGLNYAQAFANEEGSAAPKVGFTGGLGVKYHLSNRFTVGLDGMYLRRSGHSLTYTSTVQNIFLVAEVVTQRVTIQSADYLHLPLTLSYRLGTRFRLGAGVSASVLMQTSSLRSDLFLTPDYIGVVEHGDRAGYREGMHDVHLGGVLMGEYQFLRQWSVGARINFFGTPSVDHSFFGLDKSGRNTEGLLYLKFDLN